MIEKLIEKYVSKIDKKDIIKFAEENNVTLNQNEVDLIYDNIKLHWKQIIFNDHNIVLEKIKNKISSSTYRKIEELIVYGFMIVKEENKKMLEMHFKVDWEKHRLYIKDGKEYVEYTEIEGICGLLCTEKYVNTFFNIVENLIQ